MPFYDFECEVCNHQKEDLFQYIDDPSPICDGKNEHNEIGHPPIAMKKLISKTSFALKGSGWARDGYKGK